MLLRVPVAAAAAARYYIPLLLLVNRWQALACLASGHRSVSKSDRLPVSLMSRGFSSHPPVETPLSASALRFGYSWIPDEAE